MLVSEVGEFGLIELLAKQFDIPYPPRRGAVAGGLVVGLGDDALVTQRRDGSIIWTTDTMVAGEHFLSQQASWPDVGWKAMAANVSDIAAMGGTPHVALVTLLLPPDYCVEHAVELYEGLRECAEAYGVTLGGGDIVRAPVFAITIALSGWAAISHTGEAMVLRRDAARAGDLIAVTGHLGSSAGGVRLLLDGSAFKREAEARLRDAHLRPQPCVSCGRAAVRHGLRCGIDVSDGLVQDLGHIATASGVTLQVHAGRLPIDDDVRGVFPDDALRLALGGGEDYELVVTGPRPAVQAYIGETESKVTVIGEVLAGPTDVAVLDGTGSRIEMPRGGWDHFAGP